MDLLKSLKYTVPRIQVFEVYRKTDLDVMLLQTGEGFGVSEIANGYKAFILLSS